MNRLRFSVAVLVLAAPLRAQVTYSAWRTIAPHIQVAFAQVGPGACTWRFRNMDDARTLESMRFSYTYSSLPVVRGGPGDLQTGEDVLPEPLGPQEVAGGPETYRIAAACVTVNFHVTAAQWM